MGGDYYVYLKIWLAILLVFIFQIDLHIKCLINNQSTIFTTNSPLFLHSKLFTFHDYIDRRSFMLCFCPPYHLRSFEKKSHLTYKLYFHCMARNWCYWQLCTIPNSDNFHINFIGVEKTENHWHSWKAICPNPKQIA